MFKYVSLLAVMATVFSIALQAAPFSHNSRRAPRSLIVVGNYKTPRLMAETIKGLTGQPILIISNDSKGDLYFVKVAKKTVPVPAADLNEYVNHMNLSRIVIIGDERYVTRNQENLIRKSNIKRVPVVRIYGGDWGRVAEELDDMLNIGNLAREFRRNYFSLSMSDAHLQTEENNDADSIPVSDDSLRPVADNGSDDVPISEPDEL